MLHTHIIATYFRNMNNYILQSPEKPLTPARFYILLALAGADQHGYSIQGAMYSASLGSVNIKDGSLYPLLRKMFDEGLIDFVEIQTVANKTRNTYGISPHGLIALKAELYRLQHAVKIGQSRGLLNPNEPPLDLQRLWLNE
jgi:DNA-binding PadR family transcriptional regulator